MSVTFKHLTATALVFVMSCLSVMADDTQLSKASSAAKSSVVGASPTASTGRLPRYFAAIVNNEQRVAIYQIQRKAQAEMAVLEQQLAALKQVEMIEIEAILTVSQRQQLEEMRLKSSKSDQDTPVSSTDAEPTLKPDSLEVPNATVTPAASR